MFNVENTVIAAKDHQREALRQAALGKKLREIKKARQRQ